MIKPSSIIFVNYLEKSNINITNETPFLKKNPNWNHPIHYPNLCYLYIFYNGFFNQVKLNGD